jgi:hypothetical protein
MPCHERMHTPWLRASCRSETALTVCSSWAATDSLKSASSSSPAHAAPNASEETALQHYPSSTDESNASQELAVALDNATHAAHTLTCNTAKL